MKTYSFRLYINGQSVRAARAIESMRALCHGPLNDLAKIDVIDVREHPGLAEEDHVLATPTLIKLSPPPVRRIIGDLSNSRDVLAGLDLDAE